jgi:hypothetical protein
LLGEPRSTIDIDIVTDITAAQVGALVVALARDFYIDDRALQRAVALRGSTNLIHLPTQLKVDLFIAGGTSLDDVQLARRRAVMIKGRRLYVHPPEDILLQKLRWYQLGGESSDRQWRDVQAIVRTPRREAGPCLPCVGGGRARRLGSSQPGDRR